MLLCSLPSSNIHYDFEVLFLQQQQHNKVLEHKKSSDDLEAKQDEQDGWELYTLIETSATALELAHLVRFMLLLY